MRRRRTGTAGRRRVTTIICPVPDDLPDRSRWAGLKAIGMVISNTLRDGKECNEVRYYILSKYLAAQSFRRGGAQPLGH